MTNSIGARISELITSLKIKKVQFAGRLKIDQSYVTQLTNERRKPSDRLIADICREFNVNETWLRTGEGEMFRQKTTNDLISEFMGDILSGEPDFRQQLISVLARMSPEEWAILERKAVELVEGLHAQTEEPAPALALADSPADEAPPPAEVRQISAIPARPATDADVEEQVERYRQQLLLEKRMETSQALTPDMTG